MIPNDRRARPTCQKSKRSQVADAPIEDKKDVLLKDEPAVPAKDPEAEAVQRSENGDTHIWEISDGESSDGLRVWMDGTPYSLCLSSSVVSMASRFDVRRCFGNTMT